MTKVKHNGSWGRAVALAIAIGGAACSGGAGGPAPAGPPERVRAFAPAQDQTISESGVAIDDGAWRIAASSTATVRLFEIPQAGADRAVLTYRAKIKTADVQRAYLEMWVRIPGMGEFFSRGLAQPVAGTTGWAEYETPFFLAAGQTPDLVKLNLVVEGARGTVWMKDVELLRTPLKG